MQPPREFSQWIEQLRAPEAYPFRPRRVDVIETHVSAIFLAGDHAYKLKKPITLPFLDFATPEQRAHFCAEEVRLNATLAPGIYLRVLQVNFDGRRLSFGGAGVCVDHAVEMARLPGERMLDVLLAKGDFDNALLHELADVLARFHAAAPTDERIARYGEFAAVRKLVEDNFAQTDALCADSAVLPRDLHDLVEAWTLRTLDDRRPLFDQRARSGAIRDGHGDLHAGNICCREHGGLVIYDRIEFSEAFRCGDVALDLAFLLMDLDRRGLRGFAGMLAREWLVRTQDAAAAELFDFYKVYRAFVRGKVAALRAAQLATDGDPHAARAEALGYFALAAGYTLGPALVLLCGLPGSGKSHGAAALTRAFEATVLNSDTLRKRSAGLTPQAAAPAAIGAGLYDAAHSAATYQALAEQARALLGQGRRVIVDAGLRTPTARAPFLALARQLGLPAAVVHFAPPEAVVLERLRARVAAGGSESDADERVYRALRSEFEPPRRAEGAPVVAESGERSAEALGAEVLTALLRASERDVAHAGDD